ncbi:MULTISPECIES: hypothetical protein [unclassified Brenneria]|uniref:hypothetical protein n=1 Tax=unclassified Brenneria TaxID=2634434 RepID=UPI0018F0E59E|nr:hypothetical protein [Brenneria sp. L3-3C-1]MBJ7223500.1 hypothetical protein [Brenneria sp. L3-3C-1]MEE3644741.1 hypothetical protein [Brenneria sp. L3_3C_1]
MSIYDRLHQRRQAALDEVQQAEQAPAPEVPPAQPEPLLLAECQSSIQFAGLTFALPGERTRASETLIERDGGIATLRIKRQPVPNHLTLEHAAASALENLQKKHPGLAVIRQSDRLLAGHPAHAIDYQFIGTRPRHGRLVGAIVPTDGQGRQWLDIATQFDPTHAAFGDWLIDFDAILDTVAAIPAPTT